MSIHANRLNKFVKTYDPYLGIRYNVGGWWEIYAQPENYHSPISLYAFFNEYDEPLDINMVGIEYIRPIIHKILVKDPKRKKELNTIPNSHKAIRQRKQNVHKEIPSFGEFYRDQKRQLEDTPFVAVQGLKP